MKFLRMLPELHGQLTATTIFRCIVDGFLEDQVNIFSLSQIQPQLRQFSFLGK